jgi:hypothetical protein
MMILIFIVAIRKSKGDDRLVKETWFYRCLLCFKGFPILEKVILF